MTLGGEQPTTATTKNNYERGKYNKTGKEKYKNNEGIYSYFMIFFFQICFVR